MAAAYKSLAAATITSASTNRNDILRLSSPPSGAVGLDTVAFYDWITDCSAIALDITERIGSGKAVDLSMEMQTGRGGCAVGGGSGTDVFDNDLVFDGNGLLHGMPSLPFTPSYDLDQFSSTFEDPFYQPETFSSFINTSDTSEPHNHPPNANSSSNPSEPTTENPDNKLLSFGSVIPTSTLFTSSGTQTWASMTAELYGMFFVAEDVFGEASLPPAGRPMELTCYRRNLFQISGNITLNRGIKSFINEQGLQLPLYDLSATLTAVESIEGKQTEIISVPWKTTSHNGLPGSSDDKSGSSPPKWPLDLSMNPELDSSVVTIPIAWKRLQFKHATANNGRRKGLQQHYVIQINLNGMLANGDTVKLAEIQSSPIIVRGRSPRNFDSRKDVNLGTATHLGKTRTASEGRSSGVNTNTPKETPSKLDPGVTNGNYKFYALTALQQPPEWNSPSLQPLQSPSLPTSSSTPIESHRAKKPALTYPNSSSSTTTNTPVITRPPVPKIRWKSESSQPFNLNTKHAPIDLPISEDDHSGGRSGSGIRTLSFSDRSPVMDRDRDEEREREKLGSSSGRKLVGSPVETADLLYEYFPLSLDDWMPPVDAIYRPHVVHHTIVPPDLKAEQVKNKTKRYFSADD